MKVAVAACFDDPFASLGATYRNAVNAPPGNSSGKYWDIVEARPPGDVSVAEPLAAFGLARDFRVGFAIAFDPGVAPLLAMNLSSSTTKS